MAHQLSWELQTALDAAPNGTLRLVDPRSNRAFILLPADETDRTCEPSRLRREVPEGIRRSMEAFFKALPDLLTKPKLQGKWVAYHGEQRLGFGASQTRLYQKCLQSGLTAEDCYVGWIGPQSAGTEEIDPSLFEYSDIPAGSSPDARA